MDWDLIWKTVLIIIIGIFLLHISGRKSISQMTMGQTVLMIAIGTLLIQPIASKNFWQTIVLAFVLVATLFIIDLLSLKWDFFEGLTSGRSKVVIENGALKVKNLKKLRMTADQLEMHLRQNGIDQISDVKWATIEVSGQMGYSLIERKQYATKEDIDRIQLTLQEMSRQLQLQLPAQEKEKPLPDQTTLFTEIEHPKPAPPPLE